MLGVPAGAGTAGVRGPPDSHGPSPAQPGRPGREVGAPTQARSAMRGPSSAGGASGGRARIRRRAGRRLCGGARRAASRPFPVALASWTDGRISLPGSPVPAPPLPRPGACRFRKTERKAFAPHGSRRGRGGGRAAERGRGEERGRSGPPWPESRARSPGARGARSAVGQRGPACFPRPREGKPPRAAQGEAASPSGYPMRRLANPVITLSRNVICLLFNVARHANPANCGLVKSCGPLRFRRSRLAKRFLFKKTQQLLPGGENSTGQRGDAGVNVADVTGKDRRLPSSLVECATEAMAVYTDTYKKQLLQEHPAF